MDFMENDLNWVSVNDYFRF